MPSSKHQTQKILVEIHSNKRFVIELCIFSAFQHRYSLDDSSNIYHDF